MYSVVVVLALSAGNEVPECFRRGGGGGCGGAVSGSCYGGGCYGAGGYGGGCYGVAYSPYMVVGGGCCGGRVIMPPAGGCSGGGFGKFNPVPCDVKPGEKPKLKPDEKPMIKPEGGREETAAPATLRITLPVAARLSIDGSAFDAAAGSRVVVTPPLEAGKPYRYTVRAEFRVGDRLETQTMELVLRAGEEVRADFSPPLALARPVVILRR